MLRAILIKTVEQKILDLFLLNPDVSYYGREISKKIKTSIGATSMALRVLEKSRILLSEKKGKTSLYSLCMDIPYLDRLKVLNSMLLVEPMVEELRPISRKVILYGSYSSGEFNKDSDLDLFVISENRKEAIKITDNFRKKTGLPVNAVIKNQVEWMQFDKKEPEFFQELNAGIVLWEKPVDESRF